MNLETEKPRESQTEIPENKPETDSEREAIAGAELLENPPDGSFLQGLQVFIAWVKRLLADDDKQ